MSDTTNTVAEPVKPKQWWKSKLVWAGIVAVVISAYNSASVQFGLPAIPEWVYALLGSFGIWNRLNSDGFKTPLK